MRFRQSLIAALVIVGLAVLFVTANEAPPAAADHHFMRIERVMSNGDVQYVQLRMYLGGQTNLMNRQLCFYDADGNPSGSFTFTGPVANGATDATILIGTSEFDAAWTGGSPDFLFLDHPVPQPAGKVEFRFTCASTLYDAVAYGSGYTGADGFGDKFPSDLPAADQALRLDPNAPDTQGSRDNSVDYSLGAADFKKNDGTEGALGATPTPSPSATASPTPTASPNGRWLRDKRADRHRHGYANRNGDANRVSHGVADQRGRAAHVGRQQLLGRGRPDRLAADAAL